MLPCSSLPLRPLVPLDRRAGSGPSARASPRPKPRACSKLTPLRPWSAVSLGPRQCLCRGCLAATVAMVESSSSSGRTASSSSPSSPASPGMGPTPRRARGSNQRRLLVKQLEGSQVEEKQLLLVEAARPVLAKGDSERRAAVFHKPPLVFGMETNRIYRPPHVLLLVLLTQVQGLWKASVEGENKKQCPSLIEFVQFLSRSPPKQRIREKCLCAAPAHEHSARAVPLLLECSLQPTPSPLCGLPSWPLHGACSMYPGE